jgi:hypothetical protein
MVMPKRSELTNVCEVKPRRLMRAFRSELVHIVVASGRIESKSKFGSPSHYWMTKCGCLLVDTFTNLSKNSVYDNCARCGTSNDLLSIWTEESAYHEQQRQKSRARMDAKHAERQREHDRWVAASERLNVAIGVLRDMVDVEPWCDVRVGVGNFSDGPELLIHLTNDRPFKIVPDYDAFKSSDVS